VEAILGPSEPADSVGLLHPDIAEIKMWQAPDGMERILIFLDKSGWVAYTEFRSGRVSRATFERIEVGMSLADVEAILGPSEQADYIGFTRAGPGEIKVWHAFNGKDRVLVSLDKDGRVADMQFRSGK
jgi:hypothetical protein